MTDEMKDIIFSTEKHICVQAYAGCGKSTTMLEYVKYHPTEKILFIVFNKEMTNDFKKRLNNIKHNCTVSTIHSLAYRWYLKQTQTQKKLKNISIIDIKNVLNTKLEYSTLSKIMFYWNMWLSSSEESISDLELLKEDDNIYLPFVSTLWDYYTTKSNTISHNVYLKLYQLAKVKLDYDTIINDECNDCNAVMISLLINNLDKKIIGVGDSSQQILGFMHCIDGLKILKEEYNFKEYRLTNSFRVSNTVAHLCSRYLSWIKNTQHSFVGLGDTKIKKLKLIDATKDNQIHLLCRTKIGGLTEIKNVLSLDKNKKIYYIGGLNNFGLTEIERLLSYKGNIYIGGERFHINKLRKMLKDGVEDAEISRIVSIYQFAEKNKDIISLLKHSEVKNKSEADIIVLTSHVSKGLTLKNTLLGSDFPPIEDTKIALDNSKNKHSFIKSMLHSEANLCYVALTRATGILDFNNVLKKKVDKNLQK